jgi:hypothetical protein
VAVLRIGEGAAEQTFARRIHAGFAAERATIVAIQ